MVYTKGDILLPSNRVNRKHSLEGLFHPAVVWDEFYEENTDFSGIMLTHSPPNGQFENILMTKSHFEKDYEVSFSNTHFVNQVFVKFYSWGPFELVGKLTPEGVKFIEGLLNPDLPPLEFLGYINAMKDKLIH